eukprot:Lithocolla_globosa_v1_NODE_244_length_4892_cov_475.455654.p2 type:complete len:152 gc:universal NODE_244_length_4892_cov_475.455654:491-946(+)
MQWLFSRSTVAIRQLSTLPGAILTAAPKICGRNFFFSSFQKTSFFFLSLADADALCRYKSIRVYLFGVCARWFRRSRFRDAPRLSQTMRGIKQSQNGIRHRELATLPDLIPRGKICRSVFCLEPTFVLKKKESGNQVFSKNLKILKNPKKS